MDWLAARVANRPPWAPAQPVTARVRSDSRAEPPLTKPGRSAWRMCPLTRSRVASQKAPMFSSKAGRARLPAGFAPRRMGLLWALQGSP